MNKRISKLYRQMTDGSAGVRDLISSDESWQLLPPSLRDLSFKTEADVVKKLGEIESYIRKLCRNLDPQISIPILMECYARNYYDPLWSTSSHFGLGFKGSISSVVNYGIGKSSSLSKSYSDIARLVVSCRIHSNIAGLRDVFLLYPEGIEISLSVHGISTNEIAKPYVDQHHLAFKSKAEIFRTLPIMRQVIDARIRETFDDCLYVISGAKPSSISRFKDTFLSEIKGDSDFWLGLTARLMTALVSGFHRSMYDEDPVYTSIFQSFQVKLLYIPRMTNEALQEYLHKRVFWQKSWCKSRYASNPYNMIVERPITRIYDVEDMYCTSLVAAVESIYCYVEASVMSYPDWNGDKVDDIIFQRHISSAFEQRIINEFRGQGFKSGVVTDNGSWRTMEGVINLRNNSEKMPGEIDLLAVHEDRGIIVLGDCKVLSMPSAGSRMKSVIDKIGPNDSEGFHSKISKKLSWVLSTEEFKKYSTFKTFTYLILDLPLPGMWESSSSHENTFTIHPVIYENLVKDTLSRILS